MDPIEEPHDTSGVATHGFLARGAAASIALLGEFALEDAAGPLGGAKGEGGVGEEEGAATRLALIGSRALKAALPAMRVDDADDNDDALDDNNNNNNNNEATPRIVGRDFDFVATPLACAALLAQWMNAGTLRDCWVKSDLKAVALVKSGEAGNVYAADFELVRRREAWHVSNKALKRSTTSSADLILTDARETSIVEVDCSVLGITHPVKSPRLECKHIQAINDMMAQADASLAWNVAEMDDPVALEVFHLREEELEGLFQRKPGDHIHLNVSNEEFFSHSMSNMLRKRLFNHDAIHELICYEERPLYEKFKKDLKKANLDKRMFDATDLDTQLKLVREETMANALERFMLPGRVEDENEAYLLALERVCTTLTKGWLRDFAAYHFLQVCKLDVDLAQHCRHILDNPLKFVYVDDHKKKAAATDSVDDIIVKPHHLNEVAKMHVSNLLRESSFYASGPRKDTGVLAAMDKQANGVAFTFKRTLEGSGWNRDARMLNCEIVLAVGEHQILNIKVVGGGEGVCRDDDEFDDSGCEFQVSRRSRGYWRKASPTYEQDVEVKRGAVSAIMTTLFGSEDAAQIPPALFTAALFKLCKWDLDHSTALLSVLRTSAFSYLAPSKSLAAVWEQQDPFSSLIQVIRHRPVANLTIIRDYSALDEHQLAELTFAIETSSCIADITMNLTAARLTLLFASLVKSARLKAIRFENKSSYLKDIGYFANPTASYLEQNQTGIELKSIFKQLLTCLSNTPAPPAVSPVTQSFPSTFGIMLLNPPKRLHSISTIERYYGQSSASVLLQSEPTREWLEYTHRLTVLNNMCLSITGRTLSQDFDFELHSSRPSQSANDLARHYLTNQLSLHAKNKNDTLFRDGFVPVWMRVLQFVTVQEARCVVEARMGVLATVAAVCGVLEGKSGKRM
ncbi:hypothetical protein HDU98_003528, partial [Podochytrium sp. JEL0797]